MLELYLVAIIGGFVIGYLTNWLAVNALFRPRKKVLGFQGLVPRYKKEIAGKIGDNVHLVMPGIIKKLEDIPLIGGKIKEKFRDAVAEEISKMPDKELERIVKEVARKELRFIEFIGGILGMLIGLLQALVISVYL